MKCANHARSEAVAACAKCGKNLCSECAIALREGAWCRGCLESLTGQERSGGARGGKSKLIAALLSIIPGVGHMYLGLIGKGFAMMGLFFASVFLVILYSDSTGMYWMAAFLIPTLGVLFISYAVFDSMEMTEAATEDAAMRTIWERVLLNRRAIGYVLLISGIVGILNAFEEPLSRLMRTWLSVDFPVTALVIPVILVIVGGYLLRKGRAPR